MTQLLALGWRNVWRHPRRSTLAAAAVGVALGVLLVLDGLLEGMARQMLETGTRLLGGHVILHDAAYLPDRGLHDTLGGSGGADLPSLLARLGGLPGAVAAAPRVRGFGLLSTGSRSAGVYLLGVDPGRERSVTRLLDTVVEGSGLDDAPPNAVVLGRTLAEELGARVGDQVAVVTQAADGSLGNDLALVRGILVTGLAAVDRTLAVFRLADLQGLLALGPGRVHEVAVRAADPGRASRLAAIVGASAWLPGGARASAWDRLNPGLADYVQLLRAWNWVMLVIVGVFAGFGVLNTMLMAVFERTRELGVLAALGLRPVQVLWLVLVEAACVSGLGLGAGLGLGGLGTAYLARHGWDLRGYTEGMTVAGVLVDPVLRATWSWSDAAWTTVGLFALAVLSALVPAARAARQKPVDALAAPGG